MSATGNTCMPSSPYVTMCHLSALDSVIQQNIPNSICIWTTFWKSPKNRYTRSLEARNFGPRKVLGHSELGQKSLFDGPWGARSCSLFNRFLFINYVFQMSITDAFYAFNFETSNAGGMAETSSFPDWLSRLAYQLINNEFDQMSVASPSNRRSGSAAGAPAVVKSHEQHSLHNLSLLSPYNGTRRLSTCTLLKNVARHFLEVYCMNLNLRPWQINITLAGNAASKIVRGKPNCTVLHVPRLIMQTGIAFFFVVEQASVSLSKSQLEEQQQPQQSQHLSAISGI